MKDFIITVQYQPKTIFDKGKMKFRQPAFNEEDAIKEVKKHSMFPENGEIVKINEAAYKRR